MNRSWLTRGVLVASFVLAACSGSEEPQPFATTSSVESRLEARYGAPFAVARGEGRAFWLSPLGNTRRVATTVEGARDEALSLVRDFASELGTTEIPELTVVRAEQDETSGFAVRLAQMLPGTKIEIDDHGASFDLAADGTIVSASASLTDTKDFPRNLRLTSDEADRAIRAALAGRTVAFPEPLRPVARRDARGARVEYVARAQVDGEGYEVRVDASDASRVDVRPASLGVMGEPFETMAYTFRSYPFTSPLSRPELVPPFAYPISVTKVGAKYFLLREAAPKKSQIATVEKDGAGSFGEAVKWKWISSDVATEFQGDFSPVKVFQEGSLPTPYAVDVHYNSMLVDKAFRRVVLDSPSKDGVMASVTHVNSEVVRERVDLGFEQWGWKEEVKDVARTGASYDPVGNATHFGDGGFNGVIKQFVLPTGIALDVVGHEWTHAFMTRKTRSALVGMDGALQEVVCDAVGKVIALKSGDSNEDTFGSGLFLTKFAVRSFVEPKAHVAPYARVVVPKKIEKGHAPMPSHVADLATTCAAEELVDQGCVHYNAGPGNRAFYLMKEQLKKSQPKWLDAMEELWFYSAGHAVMVRSPLPAAKYESLALQQTDYARRWGPVAQKAVACAWSEVGALSASAVSARGIVCPDPAPQTTTERVAPKPDGCGSKADGYYCDSEQPYSSTQCQRGTIAGGYQCPSGTICVVADETSRAARTGEDGLPLCAPVSP